MCYVPRYFAILIPEAHDCDQTASLRRYSSDVIRASISHMLEEADLRLSVPLWEYRAALTSQALLAISWQNRNFVHDLCRRWSEEVVSKLTEESAKKIWASAEVPKWKVSDSMSRSRESL